MATCWKCNRSFATQRALDQHLEYSPVHQPSYKCEKCDRVFSDQHALDQHLEYSPAHQSTYNCKECNRSFSTQHALEQHLNYSSAHETKELEFPPPPAPSLGKWVIREEFGRGKSFGFFKCEKCNHDWVSAHAFKMYRQACKSKFCNTYSLPRFMWRNLGQHKRGNKTSQGPHDRSRCEACALGVCDAPSYGGDESNESGDESED